MILLCPLTVGLGDLYPYCLLSDPEYFFDIVWNFIIRLPWSDYQSDTVVYQGILCYFKVKPYHGM